MDSFDNNWKEKLIKRLADCEISLDDDQAEKLRIYGEELVEWNSKKNLTSITSPEEIAVLHFIDSLLVSGDIPTTENKKLLDTGTGGGFPGIPLKIFFPELEITLLDSSRKKVSFLKYITRRLKLTKTECINDRAEVYARKNIKTFDYVVSRAFTSVESFYDMVWPCVKKDGTVLAMKGPETDDEIDKLRASMYKYDGIEINGNDLTLEIREYNLPVVKHERKIISLTHK